MQEPNQHQQVTAPLWYLGALVVLTVVGPALVSVPNTRPADFLPLGVALVIGLTTAVVVGCFRARKLAARALPASLPAPGEAAAARSARGDGLGCFVFAAFFLLPAALTLATQKIHVLALVWLLGQERSWYEGAPAFVLGLGLAAWGLAFVVLGVHYRTGRRRWLAPAAILLGILGWLLEGLALWMQTRMM